MSGENWESINWKIYSGFQIIKYYVCTLPGERILARDRQIILQFSNLIWSINYVAYDGFLKTNHVQNLDIEAMLPFADLYIYYTCSFFLRVYINEVADILFIPKDKKNLAMMLKTCLVDKAIQDLNVELTTRPDWAIVTPGVINKILWLGGVAK